jgi:hypothetical protein
MTTAADRRRQLESDTRVLLSSLGDSPAEIATRLEAFGVMATPGDSHGCALAVFLHAVLAGESAVSSVKVTTKHVVLAASRRWTRSVCITLSRPLQQFVHSFDAKLFPSLIRDTQRDTPKATTDGCFRP